MWQKYNPKLNIFANEVDPVEIASLDGIFDKKDNINIWLCIVIANEVTLPSWSLFQPD